VLAGGPNFTTSASSTKTLGGGDHAIEPAV